MNRISSMLAAVVVAMSVTISVAGAVAGEPAVRQITISGQGQVAATPDMATITLGVTNEADDAATAMAETSQSVRQILGRLTTMGLAARDIQTRQLSLNPLWSNRSYDSDKRPKITGFQASNTVIVRIMDLAKLGDILDAVIADGANNFNGLQFSVQEPAPLRNAARRAAVADAIARANLLADAAGVTLGMVLSMSEQGGARMPMPMADMRVSSVPVAVGEITIQASVTMVFQIAE